MDYKTLLHWHAVQLESSLIVGGRINRIAQAPRFVEVEMEHGGDMRAHAELPQVIEIITLGGATVRVTDTFAEQTLRRVLDVLQHR